MKKLLAVLLMALLAASAALGESVSAEDTAALLSGMDYETLAAYKQAVDMELYARPESELRVLEPGLYVVGQDIAPGEYYFQVNTYSWDKGGDVSLDVYLNNEERVKDKYHPSVWDESMYLGDHPELVTLSDGNVLVCRGVPVTMGRRQLREDEKFQYTPPEGTLVPAGIYIVGEDIPAGCYSVYMATIRGGSMDVYSDLKAYNERSLDSKIRYSGSDGASAALLEEGNVVEVVKDVVMKKQEKLEF